MAPQKLPPTMTSRPNGLGSNPEHSPVSSSADEINRHTAAAVRNALKGSMRLKRTSCAASSRRPRYVLWILSLGGGSPRPLIGFNDRLARLGKARRGRRREIWPGLAVDVGLAGREDEQRREP